jgi:gliding motility-associated-like protein
MKNLYFLSLIFGLCCCNIQLKAAHLVGGEMSYECLGGNSYRINLYVYRDCNCFFCADLDDPAEIFIYNSAGNVIQSPSVDLNTVINVPIVTDGLCIEDAPDVCVERGYYTRVVNLPPSTGGYQVIYQRCCRNNTIVNINDPGDTGSTYVLDIPPVTGGCNNSSPVFTNYPPIVICVNSPLVFDHSATDVDGDSLVYSICEPFDGGSTNNSTPDPPVNYNTVDWLAPFSATNQLGGSPPMSIDPITGELTAFPTQIGQYVVGICVSEYRDGVFLSTKMRDFQFNVANCAVVLAQAQVLTTSGNDTICLGESVTLQGELFGATNFQWLPATGLSNPNSLTTTVVPTQTTTYNLIALNATSGCSDTTTVTIWVDDLDLSLPNDLSICNNQSVPIDGTTYPNTNIQWLPTTGLSNPNIINPIASPSQTTTYVVTVTTPNSTCIATADVTVLVNELPQVVLTGATTICQGDSTTLQTNGFATYLWSNGSTNQSITTNQANTYTVTVSSAAGCTATAQTSVSISQPQAIITSNANICLGETITLQGQMIDATNFEWLPTTGLSNPDSLTPTVAPIQTTTYSLVAISASGCTDTASFTIEVTDLALLLPSNLIICNNQSVPINATTAANTNVQWQPTTGLSNPNVINPIASPNQTTVYVVTVTDPNSGCTATGDVAIIVNQLPNVALTGNTIICQNDSTTLQANSFDAYLWSNGSINQSIVVNQAATYTVTVTNVAGCTATAQTSVSISQPQAIVVGNGIACENEMVTLFANADFVNYQWSTNQTTASIEVSNGAYSLTVTNANGCTATTTANVVTVNNPTPVIVGNLIIQEGNTTTLTASGDNYTYYAWSNGSNTPSIQANESNTYTLTVTDANGCIGTTSVQTKLIIANPLLIPNAFSPNNDNINDYFSIYANNVASYNIAIYNRWGENVFTSNNPTDTWDGAYKGQTQEIGVYVYKGEITFTDGEKKTFKGNLSLIR